jgi:hypothetical protein
MMGLITAQQVVREGIAVDDAFNDSQAGDTPGDSPPEDNAVDDGSNDSPAGGT